MSYRTAATAAQAVAVPAPAVTLSAPRPSKRAAMVERAVDWKWSSLRHALDGDPMPLLDGWPVARPPDWADRVDEALPDTSLTQLRLSLETGRPFGRGDWLERAARVLGFELLSRRRGRPRKAEEAEEPRLQ